MNGNGLKTVTEMARLSALQSIQITDTAGKNPFDDVVFLAMQVSGTRAGFISLQDEQRVWFKSRIGLSESELERAQAFCKASVRSARGELILSDLAAQNDSESSAPGPAVNFRSIFCFPLLSNGQQLGCLGILDDHPKTLTESELRGLRALAHQTATLLKARIVEAEDFDPLKHQRIEEVLGEPGNQLLQILEGITDGFYALDGEFDFVAINENAVKMIAPELGRDALLGRNLWTTFPGAIGSKFEVNYRKCMLERVPVSFEEQYLPLNVWREVRALPNDSGIVVFFRDVTDRKRLEQESERFLSVSADILCIANTKGFFTRVSQACTAILGYTPEEMCAVPIVDLIHPGDVESTLSEFGNLARGAAVLSFENRYRCKDGTYRNLAWRSVPVDQTIYAVARDVTEQKQIKVQLIQADRLIALGTLAAGVAHEINNPLSYSLNSLNLAAQELDEIRKFASSEPLESVFKLVAYALEGVYRVKGVVNELKLFSRNEQIEFSRVDVEKALNSAVKLAMQEIKTKARLITHSTGGSFVLANEGNLVQVFLNLLMNAAQAIEKGQPKDNLITLNLYTTDPGTVCVEITDTGCGMSELLKGKIFDPFFTTKPIGQGTGLGLAVCHGLITTMGGSIEVESEAGRGSTFRVRLQTCDAEEAVNRVEDSSEIREDLAAQAVRSLNLLIIDDESRITTVLEKGLKKEHRVRCFNDSSEALEFLRGAPELDFILCDLLMPGLTGMDLHEQLTSQGHGQEKRMVFMTGGAFTSHASQFLESIANPRIDKPFELKELRALLVELGSQ